MRQATDISNDRYQVVRGPSGTHQGVAIALQRSKVMEYKAIHQDLHTLHTVAYQLKIKRVEEDVIAVNALGQGQQLQQ